jgi:hypothetical protein
LGHKIQYSNKKSATNRRGKDVFSKRNRNNAPERTGSSSA